jgi:hypothetical protein
MPIIAKKIPEHVERLKKAADAQARKAAETEELNRREAVQQAVKGKLKGKKWKNLNATEKDDLLQAVAIKLGLIDE